MADVSDEHSRDGTGDRPTATAAVPGDSFERTYRELRPAMDRLAFLLVGSRSVGDELVHDAFTRLYEHLDEVDNPAGFVRVALVRLCSTARSRREMERERLGLLDRLPDPPEVGIPDIDETWDALSRLTPDRRVVLVLRFYEDLTHAQIAELLECPEATVRTRLHRGLADLRKEIER